MTPDIRPDLPPNMSVSRVTFRDRSKIARVGDRWCIVLPNGDIMRPAYQNPARAIRLLESWWRIRAAEQFEYQKFQLGDRMDELLHDRIEQLKKIDDDLESMLRMTSIVDIYTALHSLQTEVKMMIHNAEVEYRKF